MASTRQVRDWALGKGWDVPSSGMLPKAIIAAFNAAHPDDPAKAHHGKGTPPSQLRHFREWGGPDDTPETRRERSQRGGNAAAESRRARDA